VIWRMLVSGGIWCMFISNGALRAVLGAGGELGLPIRKCWGRSWARLDPVCGDWLAIECWLGLDKRLGNLASKSLPASICSSAAVRASLPITYRAIAAG
jgi:hypothetical protein